VPSGTVLVVDDDPVIVNLLQVNFEIEGYDVLTATAGEAGLAQARHGQPDAIVLDVMMPGIDGLEVARRLRAAPETRNIPIILLSAKAQSADIQAGLSVADEYITKPFEPLELLERVAAVIARRREVSGPGARGGVDAAGPLSPLASDPATPKTPRIGGATPNGPAAEAPTGKLSSGKPPTYIAETPAAPPSPPSAGGPPGTPSAGGPPGTPSAGGPPGTPSAGGPPGTPSAG
jgi:CheY-like chemotaxis protein